MQSKGTFLILTLCPTITRGKQIVGYVTKRPASSPTEAAVNNDANNAAHLLCFEYSKRSSGLQTLEIRKLLNSELFIFKH